MRGSYESEEVCTVYATGDNDAQGRAEEAGNAEGAAFVGEADSEGSKRRSKVYVRARWRWISALALLCLFCLALPRVAYAASEQIIISDGMVFYQNSDRIDRGFMVMAYNRFNAGAMICGYDPNSFTAEQKEKLTQYVSGNNFYMLCETLQTVNENGVPSWASTQFNLFGSIWDLNSDFNGMEAFYGGFSDNELNLAKQDIQKVLNGEELQPPSGGGSGGTAPEGYLSFTANMEYHYYTTTDSNLPIIVSNSGMYYTYKPYYRYDAQQGEYIYYFDDGSSDTKCAELGPTINVLVEDSIVNAVSGNDYGLYIAAERSNVGTKYRIKFQLFKSTGYTFANNAIINTLSYVNSISYSGYTTTQYAYPYSSSNGNYFYDYDGGNTIYIRKRDNVSKISFGNYTGTQNRTFTCQLLQGGYTGGNPVEPPGQWPDNPTVVAPEPPELPEPRDPVIPNPPSDPVPTDPPTYITQPTYNVSVFTADLQGILDAMDEHCIHLQNALYTDLQGLYNKLSSVITSEGESMRSLVSSRFDWLGTVIVECLETLDSDIYDYFHWLAQQFDFQNSGGYNDSTVVAWLKKIYAKLGGGSPVNPKPVDPVSDPFDFGKWLTELWNTFIADLIAIGAEGLASILDDLQQLTQKFPFSIPWDIAAMLALLVAQPQTPVIQWPMFTYDGTVHIVQTTIDLTPYNNYVEPVRVMIKIGFAAVLAWKTKDMMELLTLARGGNNA